MKRGFIPHNKRLRPGAPKSKIKQWEKKINRRRRMAKHKASRLSDEDKWRVVRGEVLADPKHIWCPVALSGVLGYVRQIRTTQGHHLRGRAGKLLYDKRFVMGVSHVGHEWINRHGKKAMANLWLLPFDNKAWRTWVLNNPLTALFNNWTTDGEIEEFNKQVEREKK